MRRAAAILGYCSVISALSVMTASPAAAQLGIIKKMATEKAKEAAGVKEPDNAQKGGGAKIDYTVTDERLTAIVGALTPYVEAAKRQVAEAEQAKAVQGMKADHEAKVKAVSDCMSKVAGSGALPDMGWMQTPKGEAFQARMVALGKRVSTVSSNPGSVAALALQDTMTVMSAQQVAYMYPKSGCAPMPYMPKALLDYNAASQARMMQGGTNGPSRGDNSMEVPADRRANMTTGQFGRVREVIAIWLLQQSGDLPPTAYKFTDAEKSVLSAKSAQIKELTPLFKSNALMWATWGDIKSW